MKQAIADVGGDPAGSEVQGTAVLRRNETALSTSTHPQGRRRSRLRSGATDVRFVGSPPDDPQQAAETVSRSWSAAFREVTQGRG